MCERDMYIYIYKGPMYYRPMYLWKRDLTKRHDVLTFFVRQHWLQRVDLKIRKYVKRDLDICMKETYTYIYIRDLCIRDPCTCRKET